MLQQWLVRRRTRYKKHRLMAFDEVRGSLKTGDILLFHKTVRSGVLESFELDFAAPLLFGETEFRHSGIVLKEDGQELVVECATELHSGYTLASYPIPGRAIRIVPLEPLLEAYARDNGDPHFGVKSIATEIPAERFRAALAQYGPVRYLKPTRAISIYFSRYVLPAPWHRSVMHACREEMMCSEFVHSILHRCGVLKEYPSKLFPPYFIENTRRFRELEIVGYSDVIRFGYPAGGRRVDDAVAARGA